MTEPTTTEPTGIPSPVVIEMVKNLLRFPFPQICRHLVAAELLGALEDAGCSVPDGAIAATFNAYDEEALELMS